MKLDNIHLKGFFRLALLAALILAFGSEITYSGPASKKKKPPPKGPELYSLVWKRVKPRKRSVRRRSRRSAVAGVRGTKSKKGLQPYWKGKKDVTPAMQEFIRISKLISKSKHGEVTKPLEEWLKQYPKSKLAPRVKLSLALNYAYLDRKDDATKLLNQWLKDYPDNEYHALAKQLLTDLSGGG